MFGVEKHLENLYNRFKQELEAVNGECHRVENVQQACELIHNVFRANDVYRVVIAKETAKPQNHDEGNGRTFASALARLADHLGQAGITVLTDNYRENAVNAEAGITGVQWAIAETGTLVQVASDVNERLCSTLPPIHVALALTGTLVATLADVLRMIQNSSLVPGFVGFITGPSRTSDIERVLTIGVHGPVRLVAVFVDRLERND